MAVLTIGRSGSPVKKGSSLLGSEGFAAAAVVYERWMGALKVVKRELEENAGRNRATALTEAILFLPVSLLSLSVLVTEEWLVE